ncbi:MAG: imidazoleglycerol-phosphate synthase [Myxococcaceae bacterium]|nr:imidazoleglycerol-phosphate synthase [Myxococcaceae bacterium]
MKRSFVRSSSVRSLGYDSASAVLEIEYGSGSVYRYAQVPEAVYRLLRRAPSVGTFVNKVIKPHFEARRVRLAPARARGKSLATRRPK